jgi:hypothetical protein
LIEDEPLLMVRIVGIVLGDQKANQIEASTPTPARGKESTPSHLQGEG